MENSMEVTKKALSDCCYTISDGDHLPPPKVEEGIPFITISNITEANHISFDDVMYVPEDYYNNLPENKKARKGDILYSVVGSFGKPVYITEDKKFVFQRHIAILRPNDTVNGRYLYYVMLNPYFFRRIDKIAIGCSQRTVTLDALRSLSIELPDKTVQNSIVSVLSAIDAKIDVNNEINDNLQQQLQLLYNYWFKQFDFPDAHGEPYRSSGGKMKWSEQLKQYIPQDWKEALLGDIYFISGNPTNTEECPKDLYYTPIDVIPKRTITFAGGLSSKEANSSLQLYEENDVLLGSMRVYFHRVCIASQPGITRTTTIVLRPKVKEHLGYAYQVLNDDNAILFATQHSSGTQQPYITWNNALEQYSFAMPQHKELISKFSEISAPLIEQAKKCARENVELQQLRDWLLPMLMNGQATIGD